MIIKIEEAIGNTALAVILNNRRTDDLKLKVLVTRESTATDDAHFIVIWTDIQQAPP